MNTPIKACPDCKKPLWRDYKLCPHCAREREKARKRARRRVKL